MISVYAVLQACTCTSGVFDYNSLLMCALQITVMQVVANIFQYQKCSYGTASSVSIPVSSIISFGSVTASRMGLESSAEWPPPCNCCNWPFLFWLAFLLINPAVWLYTCPLHSHHDLQLEQQQYINILMYCNAGKYTV